MNFLFCPPLSPPIVQQRDDTGTDRRDLIMPNYATRGFWHFMRNHYRADFIVAEAKNYVTPVSKAPAGRLPDLLDLALLLAPQPGLAAQLASQMPAHSVRLAALAATLASQQVTQYKAEALTGEQDAVSALAGSLNNLSVRLGALGRREDALAAIEEAADIFRELAAARPDAFRPDLAQSLNNLSVRLGALGLRERALAAIEEAVTIRRELAAARPDAFRPDLAMSLSNLAKAQAELGRREQALAVIQEAVAIRRELAARWPDAYHHELEQSFQFASWEHGEDLSDSSPREPKT